MTRIHRFGEGSTAAADAASSLPADFVRRIEAWLGAEAGEFLAALIAPPTGIRSNGLRLSPREFESIAPFPVRSLDYPPAGFLVDEESRPGRHPYHAAGVYYVQDPSAMAVGALVGATPGERVIDVAAAPGGKATHLAATMRNEGLLVANDVDRRRAVEVVRNFERCGVRNGVVTSQPVTRLAEIFGPTFDRVLLDAPCSGESMFHKSGAAREGWSVAAVAGCARRQSELIGEAAALVRPGGSLYYSTCTFAREENEGVVETFLAGAPEFELAPLPRIKGAICEGASAAPIPPPETRPEPGNRDCSMRWLLPHRFPGAGHFIARLRRLGDEIASPAERFQRPHTRAKSRQRPGCPAEACIAVEEFMASVYPSIQLDRSRFVAMGTTIYEIPEPAGDLLTEGIMAPGVELGSWRKGRFEPAHALAMSLDPAKASASVALEIGDPRVIDYLKGHPLDDPGPPGWVPVTVDGFALGWGKRVDGKVKNHLPKGLRWHG